jgi:hypothetical protein
MDQLPDLQSDADVDALMARLRAQLAGPASTAPAITGAAATERSGNALRDLLAVQEEYAAATCRALQLIAETLEEIGHEAERPRAARTQPGAVAPRRVNGRPRKTR